MERGIMTREIVQAQSAWTVAFGEDGLRSEDLK